MLYKNITNVNRHMSTEFQSQRMNSSPHAKENVCYVDMRNGTSCIPRHAIYIESFMNNLHISTLNYICFMKNITNANSHTEFHSQRSHTYTVRMGI